MNFDGIKQVGVNMCPADSNSFPVFPAGPQWRSWRTFQRYSNALGLRTLLGYAYMDMASSDEDLMRLVKQAGQAVKKASCIRPYPGTDLSLDSDEKTGSLRLVVCIGVYIQSRLKCGRSASCLLLDKKTRCLQRSLEALIDSVQWNVE